MPKTEENACHYNRQQYYEVKCPYCDYKHEIETTDWACRDGDEEEYECSNCQKEFVITVNISVDFDSDYKKEE